MGPVGDRFENQAVARALFSELEARKVGWSEARSVECPHCGAEARRECRAVSKIGSEGRTYRRYMSGFHKARKDAFLITRMFIIPEELELADVFA